MFNIETLRQMFVAGTTLIASLSSGAAMGYPGVLLHQLKANDSCIQVDLDTASWIGSIHGLAGIVSIIMPTIMQWKGRRLAFITSCLVLLIGWILAYFAQSASIILLSESFHGFGANSILTVSHLCVSEMVSPKHRNVYIQSFAITQALGLALAGIMTKLLHWKTVSIVMGIPITIACLIAFKWPESPYWLAWRGEKEKCEKSFTWLRGNKEESIRELELLLASKTGVPNKGTLYVLRKLWRDVTNKAFYTPALHILLLFFLTYWSGGIVIILYSIELIQKATKNDEAAFLGSIAINFILFIGIFTSNILIRFFNNKSVLIYSSLTSSVCLFGAFVSTLLQSKAILAESSLLCLYFLIAFMVTSSIGLLPASYSISSELMPVKYRGLGGTLIMLFTCLLHTFSLKSSPYLFLYIGLHGTFLLYTVNVLICILLVYLYVPETKGKTLHEIENFYLFGTFENSVDVKETVPIVSKSS